MGIKERCLYHRDINKLLLNGTRIFADERGLVQNLFAIKNLCLFFIRANQI